MSLYEGLAYTNSAELCEQMAERCDTALLAFSTGKDSIASWLQMRKYFKRIIPYYKYHVPGLKFVERSLAYYEDFFGCHIYRLPSPAFFRWMNYGVHETPDRLSAAREYMFIDLDTYTDDTVADILRYNLGLSEDVYSGVGVRMADTPLRRVTIRTSGAVNHGRKSFYPVYDWVKKDLVAAFEEADIRLPPDYKVFGCTFDGLTYKYLRPMREYFPEDYQHLLEWFPLAELEIARYEGLDSINAKREAS